MTLNIQYLSWWSSYKKWESEWLLFNAKWTVFQLYHDENKLRFDEMMMTMMTMSALYKTTIQGRIFIVFVHWNNSPWVDMSLHSNTLFWFRVNQSLLLVLSALCLAEKQHILILFILVWPNSAESYNLPHWSMLTITPSMWIFR